MLRYDMIDILRNFAGSVPATRMRLPSAEALHARRSIVLVAAAAAWLPSVPKAALAADPYQELRARLAAPIVSEAGDGTMAGRPEPPLPAWLSGRWRAEQTLTEFNMPLGVQFIGAAGRPLSEAEASAAETRAQIGKPVRLELRFDAVGDGAREDRAFNSRSRLDAFAGRSVTKRSRACAVAGVDSPGLACTLVEFKGPVSQKQIVNSMRVATPSEGTAVVFSEFTRLIFARLTMPGDTRNFPPITTDSETIVALAPDAVEGGGPPEVVRGKLRLISYLQPYDALYFAAGRKSVSVSDYSLTLTRLPETPPEDAPVEEKKI